MDKRKSQLFSIFILIGLICAFPAMAYADCTSPAGPAGRIDYTSAAGEQVFKYCNGTDWVPWAGEPVTGAPAPLSGFDLGDLGDVTLGTPANGECLTYNGSAWVDGTCGGGGTPAGSGANGIYEIQFNSGGSFGASSGLVFTSAGRVGIGTNNPTEALHVYQNSASPLDFLLENDGDNNIDINVDANRSGANSTISRLAYFWNGNRVAMIRGFTGDNTTNKNEGYLVFSTRGAGDPDTVERMRIAKDGKIGIGNTSPSVRLDVTGIMRAIDDGAGCTAAARGAIRFNSAGAAMELCSGTAWGALGSGGSSLWQQNGSDIYYNSGRVGIGDSTPDAELDVVGDIHYTGVITDVSDRSVKENIAPLAGSLDKVAALRGVSFTMKDDPDGRTELGFIAQDVEPVFPELVSTKRDGLKTLNYIGMIAPLAEAIRDLKAENEALRARIEALEAQNAQSGGAAR